MEEEDPKNVYNASCRVCLINNNDGIRMASLFATTYQSVSISKMMNLCTTLVIAQDDGLPSLICTNCLGSLISAYEFQIQCQKTDRELRAELRMPLSTCKIDETRTISADSIPTEVTPISTDTAVKNEESDCSMSVEMFETNLTDGEIDEKGDLLCKSINNVNENELLKKEFFEAETKEDLAKLTEEVCIEDSVAVTDSWSDSEDERPLKKTASVKTKKEFPCFVCKKIFNKPYRLLRHSSVHNMYGKPFECDICKIRFVSKSSLIRHAIKHTDILTNQTTSPKDKPLGYECAECSRFFIKQESLSAHLKSHKQQMHGKEYKCEYCEKTFNKMNMLTRHSMSHDKFKHHKCNVCDQKFALASQLIDHMNRHRGIKPHVCHLCNKGFQQSCTLKDHIRTHSKETPFLCSECGKSFNNSSNLRQHIRRHSGDKPFVCNECPSRFVSKGALTSHMSTHTLIKPYVCDLCGSTFTKPYSLTKHKRIHTGERPYPCEMCDMRFNSSDHVKRHMRTHTGEKPYKCKFCDRAFAQSNDLVKHTRSHVGDNTYQCKDCPAAFRLQGELKQHSHMHFVALKDSKIGATQESSEKVVEQQNNPNSERTAENVERNAR